MLSVVKVGSVFVEGDTRKECEDRIGKRVAKLSKIKIFDKDKKFLFDVVWDEGAPVFRAMLTVYYCFNLSDVDSRHCEICKEAHGMFYNNSYFNCHRCEYGSYLERRQVRERDMKSAGKEILRRQKNI